MVNGLKPLLLTGASGYLGGRVLENLRARGRQCVATSASGAVGEACDLTDEAAVQSLLRRVEPSGVIHCAARVPKLSAGYDDADAANSSVAMVKALALNAPCRIVFISSMTVYGESSAFPVDEAAASPPSASYARGKWQAEQLVLERRHAGDLALRLPGLFGPPRQSGILYNAARAFLTTGRFDISSPAVLWAAMAVEDAAEYVARAAMLDDGLPSEALNVGYEGEFSIPSAVAQIAALCHVEWQPPAGSSISFSMRLQRLTSRYGMIESTFAGRLAELVQSVRDALERQGSGVCNAH